MTVENELIRVGDSLFKNRAEMLWLPEYCMPEHINTGIPTEADLFAESSVQKYPIGAQLMKMGGLWRYSKAGAAMGAGHQGFLKVNYYQCPGKAGNSVGSGFEGALYAAVAAAGTSFQIADTAATKNLYAGAYFVVYNDTDAVYEQHIIIGNDASDGTTTTCYIASPGFKKAMTTSYGVTIYLNRYQNVRSALSVGMNYNSAIGVAQFAIQSGYFFWLHTAGPVTGLTFDSGYTTGITAYRRIVYANTDGSIIDAGSSYYQPIGYLISRTSSDYADNFVMLQLDTPGMV